MKRKVWITISIIILIAAVAIIWILRNQRNNGSNIRIGAVLPLTGSMGAYGDTAKNAMELAVKEINDKGGINGHPLEIIYEDSQTDPKTATTVLQKLISSDSVPAVIGDLASGSVLAMAPIAERNQVVLLSPGASTPDISNAGEFIFRNWQSDVLEGEIDAKYAYNKLGWRSVAVLYINNASGAGLNKVFSESFSSLGGEIVAQEAFAQDATDMRAQIRKIAAAKPNGVFMPGYPREMAAALKQMKEAALGLPVLATQAFDDPEVISRSGGASEGVIFSVPRPPDQSDPTVKHFREAYLALYNKEPGVTADTAFDAVRIIAWAFEQSAKTGPEIRDKIKDIQSFPGAAGPTTFDRNGDVIREFVFMTVRNGQKVVAQ